MLSTGSHVRVYVAAEPVDLRCGHDGLSALVRSTLALDPYAGHLFAFIGKRAQGIKVLFWDRGGFVVYYKRLAKGRFRLPKITPDATSLALDATELSMLLGGFDLSVKKRSRSWEPKRAA